MTRDEITAKLEELADLPNFSGAMGAVVLHLYAIADLTAVLERIAHVLEKSAI